MEKIENCYLSDIYMDLSKKNKMKYKQAQLRSDRLV